MATATVTAAIRMRPGYVSPVSRAVTILTDIIGWDMVTGFTGGVAAVMTG